MSMTDEYRSDPPDDLPPDFNDWPYEERIEWAMSMYSRSGIIMQLLTRSNYPGANEVEKDHELTKEELAAIYIGFRGYADD